MSYKFPKARRFELCGSSFLDKSYAVIFFSLGLIWQQIETINNIIVQSHILASHSS